MSTSAITPSPLEAFGKAFDRAPHRLGRLRSASADLSIEVLREQYRADGYLWLRGLLDPVRVRDFRGWVFSQLSTTGLTLPDSDPSLGVAGKTAHDRAAAQAILAKLVRTARFEGFCAQPALVDFIEELIEAPAYLHPRKMMRYTAPGSGVATPAHYDLIYLRGGTDSLVTAWVPLGDCAVAEGGLAYLEGSHAAGQIMEREFSARNAELSPEQRISAYNANMSEGGWVSKDLPDMAERFDARWLVADYEAGDVVLHSPYMIHASTNNVSLQDRIRLSLDIRFQDVDAPIDARWARHWRPDDNL